MKFEELFQPKPGSVAAEMKKTIDELNKEVKELRRKVEYQAKLEAENAALQKAMAWKTQRIKTLSDGLHAIEDVLKKTATSIWTDAVESGNKEGQ